MSCPAERGLPERIRIPRGSALARRLPANLGAGGFFHLRHELAVGALHFLAGQRAVGRSVDETVGHGLLAGAHALRIAVHVEQRHGFQELPAGRGHHLNHLLMGHVLGMRLWSVFKMRRSILNTVTTEQMGCIIFFFFRLHEIYKFIFNAFLRLRHVLQFLRLFLRHCCFYSVVSFWSHGNAGRYPAFHSFARRLLRR